MGIIRYMSTVAYLQELERSMILRKTSEIFEAKSYLRRNHGQ